MEIKEKNPKRERSVIKGFIGESYTMYKLALVGLQSQNLQSFNDFDLIVENGARVEVKTSSLNLIKDKRRAEEYTRKVWSFNNKKCSYKYMGRSTRSEKAIPIDRKCDFFVLVCLDKSGTRVLKEFIVPKEIVGKRMVLTIPYIFKKKNKDSLRKYEGKWNLIEDFGSSLSPYKVNKPKGI